MKIPIVSERTDEVRVEFRHVFDYHELENGKRGAFSEATIIWTPRGGGFTQVVAVARVHPNDAPERRIGRKVSLARALQIGGFTRDERKQIWTALINIKRMRV